MTRLRRALLHILVGATSAVTAVLIAVGPAAPADATAPAGPSGPSVSRVAGGAPARYLLGLDVPAGDDPAGVTGRVAAAVATGGGRLLAVQEAVGTVVVEVPPAVAAELASLPGVGSVTLDGGAHVPSPGYPPVAQAGRW